MHWRSRAEALTVCSVDTQEKFLRDFKAGNYSLTKLANILFTFELQQRWQGKGIQACAVDFLILETRKGAIFSDIWRTSIFNKPPISWALKVAFAPTWDGAITVYHAATTPLKTDHDNTPIRLFARGGFAWWGVTRPNSTLMMWLMGPPAAALDWPVRYLSKRLFFSKAVTYKCPQIHKLMMRTWHPSSGASLQTLLVSRSRTLTAIPTFDSNI